jgi:hypothetical protein
MAKLQINPSSNRRISLCIEDGDKITPFEVDSKNGAYIAAQILCACAESFLNSGATQEDLTKKYTKWAVASTTSVGLGPSPIPNHESVLFQFGDTVLSVPIEKTKLRHLGEALVALSATSVRPQ